MRNITAKREVRLTDEQRQRLETITRNGSASAKKIQHARVLLLSDLEHPAGGYSDDQIASILGIHCNTVAQVRTRWTLQLLCQEMVARRIVASIGYETIRKTLEKPLAALAEAAILHPRAGGGPGSSRRWNRSWTPMRGR